MNKKHLMGFALLATLALVACNGGKKDTAEVPTIKTEEGKEIALPVAYVRMDSVLAEYTYSKEVQAKLEADATASRKRLQGKAAALQKAMEDFQRKAQINAFVSDAQAKSEQERVVKMQQEVAGLEQSLSGELAQKSALMQEDLIKKIQEELKLFNGGRFKLILSNATVLFADEALDITEPFIKHLNENYTPATTEEKKEPKK